MGDKSPKNTTKTNKQHDMKKQAVAAAKHHESAERSESH
jgi:hypothetical protein